MEMRSLLHLQGPPLNRLFLARQCSRSSSDPLGHGHLSGVSNKYIVVDYTEPAKMKIMLVNAE